METFFNQKFFFGEIVVEPQANLVIFNGRPITMEPKIIMLLCYFASNPMQVISRQKIAEAVWPDVVVSEEAITRAVFSLRKTILDDPKQPKYIETIPKKGYRFLAKASFCKEKQEKKTKKISLLIAGIALIALSISLLWNNSQPIEIAQVQPFTSMPGSEWGGAIDKSGTKMVFIHDNGGKNRLLVKQLNTEQIEVLNDDNWIKQSPYWLDTNTLVYIRCLSENCEIVRQHSGQPAEIIYTSSSYIYSFTYINTASPQIVFSQKENNESTQLFSLSLVNGKLELLQDKFHYLPARVYQPTFSEKDNILYCIGVETENQKLLAINYATGELIFSKNIFSRIYDLSLSLASHQLLVAGIKSDTSGIWLFDTRSENTELVLRASGAETIIGVSANPINSKIYYANYLSNIDVATIKQSGEIDSLEQLNSDSSDRSPSFASNDKQIMFLSNRTGKYEIWMYNKQSGESRQVTRLGSSYLYSPRISNNGEFVVFVYKKEQLMIGVIELKSGELISSAPIPELKFPLAWSLDDQFVYVSEHLKNINLFKYDRQTLTQSPFKPLAGLFAKEINNGKSLVTFDYKSNSFISIDLISGKSSSLTQQVEGSQYLAPGQVLLKDESIIISKKGSSHTEVLEYPILNNKNKQHSFKKITTIDDYWISGIHSNGQEFLGSKNKPPRGDIMQMVLKQ